MKVKKIHGDIVKNKSARAKKTRGGAPIASPRLFRVKGAEI